MMIFLILLLISVIHIVGYIRIKKNSNQDLFGYCWWNLDVLCTNMRMVCL